MRPSKFNPNTVDKYTHSGNIEQVLILVNKKTLTWGIRRIDQAYVFFFEEYPRCQILPFEL